MKRFLLASIFALQAASIAAGQPAPEKAAPPPTEEDAEHRQQLRAVVAQAQEWPALSEAAPGQVLARQFQFDAPLLKRPGVVGSRTDGIRFTAPKDATGFVWAFTVPSSMLSWYIVRKNGPMMGFSVFYRRTKDRAGALVVPGESVEMEYIVLQSLPDPRLTPGEEYLVWFEFSGEKTPPPALNVRWAFTSAKSAIYQPTEIAKALKL